MSNKRSHLDKKLQNMPKPNIQDDKKNEMHQSLMEFSHEFENEKRRGFRMKRFMAGIGGITAAALVAFLIITSYEEDPSNLAGDQSQNNDNDTNVPANDPDRDDGTEDKNVQIDGENDGTTKDSDSDEDVIDALEKYNVFSDFSLYHPSYLSEARTFYESENTDFILAYGHHANAVTKYELFDVKDNEVKMIRSVVDETDFERIESILHVDNWEEAMVEYLLDEAEPMEEMFFTYDEEQSETEVVIEGETYMLYPVHVGEHETFFFKEGKGIWVKLYEDEDTINMYGDEQKTFRIEEE
ncbi:hypothetical protein QA612_15285 [Evansella sp. AB-P1]|uniref:hypothetical protein n=1 Tax=Evansella sp. AB-P1 TaxID=3037653 RepID=UPI00241DACC1|nr:hypothetical protein [Evansella sp. AB-P1]MDG5788834.1 hypothetical protein [Evansella sp. AB-P1]